MGDLITVQQRNIEELGFPECLHGKADGLFLDLPGPWHVRPCAMLIAYRLLNSRCAMFTAYCLHEFVAECGRISAEVLLSTNAACATDRPDPLGAPACQTFTHVCHKFVCVVAAWVQCAQVYYVLLVLSVALCLVHYTGFAYHTDALPGQHKCVGSM